jgi:chromatin segregation and condensation protein Rec8/ScpA/Scc1 (kleisin family)
VILLDVMVLIGVSTLFAVVLSLVVGVLALRHAWRNGELAEKLAERQNEDRENLEIIRGLRQGLDWERQERKNLREELNREHQERLRAQQALVQAQHRAESAEQKAMREATRQLRERMDDYLKELGETGTWPGGGIRRVK